MKSESFKIGTTPTYQNHMTEKSEKKVDFQKISTTPTAVEVKRGRGRPKGAKNKPKELKATDVSVAPRKRGRPKGAKNKPKEAIPESLVKFKESDKAPNEKKKRGRPRKVVTTATVVVLQQPTVVAANTMDEHPLVLAAKWLEKNMHPTEMQYYRTRANRNSSPLTTTIVGDILGFFNVQNAEICKQIKKNNFIDRVCNS